MRKSSRPCATSSAAGRLGCSPTLSPTARTGNSPAGIRSTCKFPAQLQAQRVDLVAHQHFHRPPEPGTPRLASAQPASAAVCLAAARAPDRRAVLRRRRRLPRQASRLVAPARSRGLVIRPLGLLGPRAFPYKTGRQRDARPSMTDRLVVLLTNIWLAHRAGSETVVRDVALGLLRRGHRPIVYSPALGAPAEEIAACGVCVIDDLRQLAETPDIIHAHHAIPCGEALIRFPQTPAIYVCHAFSPWMEAPVHFPQIGAYVAVDEACRDRLVHAEGIAPDRVTILRNAVDLRRVPPRLQPPRARPQRVLAFGKAAVMAEPRIACERLGLEYHALGDVGRTVAHPEHELVDFDLVFASARAALEAMCCGCAVIACDSRGSAGLVTPKNFDLLRAQNFGLRCLHEAATVDHCMEEIGRASC